tara:strand:+ start:903 stop:2840 length:1938 start_codon:yes stop_codon:yes gene_type:complete
MSLKVPTNTSQLAAPQIKSFDLAGAVSKDLGKITNYIAERSLIEESKRNRITIEGEKLAMTNLMTAEKDKALIQIEENKNISYDANKAVKEYEKNIAAFDAELAKTHPQTQKEFKAIYDATNIKNKGLIARAAIQRQNSINLRNIDVSTDNYKRDARTSYDNNGYYISNVVLQLNKLGQVALTLGPDVYRQKTQDLVTFDVEMQLRALLKPESETDFLNKLQKTRNLEVEVAVPSEDEQGKFTYKKIKLRKDDPIYKELISDLLETADTIDRTTDQINKNMTTNINEQIDELFVEMSKTRGKEDLIAIKQQIQNLLEQIPPGEARDKARKRVDSLSNNKISNKAFIDDLEIVTGSALLDEEDFNNYLIDALNNNLITEGDYSRFKSLYKENFKLKNEIPNNLLENMQKNLASRYGTSVNNLQVFVQTKRVSKDSANNMTKTINTIGGDRYSEKAIEAQRVLLTLIKEIRANGKTIEEIFSGDLGIYEESAKQYKLDKDASIIDLAEAIAEETVGTTDGQANEITIGGQKYVITNLDEIANAITTNMNTENANEFETNYRKKQQKTIYDENGNYTSSRDETVEEYNQRMEFLRIFKRAGSSMTKEKAEAYAEILGVDFENFATMIEDAKQTQKNAEINTQETRIEE